MSPTPYRQPEPQVLERAMPALYCAGCKRFVRRLILIALSRYRCDMCAHDPLADEQEESE